MKIVESSILMGSQRTYSEAFEEKTELRFWVDQSTASNNDRVSISQEARACVECESGQGEDGLMQDMSLEISLERLITEILSGRKVKVVRTEDLSGAEDTGVAAESPGPEESGQTSAGWGLDYSHETTYREKEAVSLDAQGVVRTTDGKTLDFTLHLDMSREYVETNSISIKAGDALKDPLVINFDGTAVQLANGTFGFDINADGMEESLPGLSAGKGYLAIDLNSDGIINNGNELFGPSTGSGFSELSAYDADRNGWIDENDEVYQRLSVLSFNESGVQVLQGIQDVGVGAIYTSSSLTQFDMKDPLSGELLGRVKSSGIYLNENGSVGTIQQIDLKV